MTTDFPWRRPDDADDDTLRRPSWETPDDDADEAAPPGPTPPAPAAAPRRRPPRKPAADKDAARAIAKLDAAWRLPDTAPVAALLGCADDPRRIAEAALRADGGPAKHYARAADAYDKARSLDPAARAAAAALLKTTDDTAALAAAILNRAAGAATIHDDYRAILAGDDTDGLLAAIDQAQTGRLQPLVDALAGIGAITGRRLPKDPVAAARDAWRDIRATDPDDVGRALSVLD